ncbi:hypothetical protein HG536_0C06000 [Torulaspora globosa]|uniref:Conserved oligomeric Golgi complex subunit 8 n=1 Tax=Torulaspora globosa TaxID=48254 RepID=A0A7G3ZFZ5_9SACH|nr:uncharacterized protein HG536_0C06000 [Torulaspora globosa]QLL32431.1 hypothetical protein HG536_0C06000 [Torulaspora globosa]
MDLVLETLTGAEWGLSEDEKRYGLAVLSEVLQSDTNDYEKYFSSSAVEGSVVEDIAEVDAQISAIERRLRSLLVDNKTEVIREALDSDAAIGSKIVEIRQGLEQLWELDNEDVSRSREVAENGELLALLDPKDAHEGVGTKSEDEFHAALNKLKDRVRQEQSGDHEEMARGLGVVLENLTKMTDLMELPFLARTCIRTGHYREAVMLYNFSKSLPNKFPGSSIVERIHRNVSDETTMTMLTGLVRLLSTNLTANQLKKLLNYLVAIPPFDGKDKSCLLQVYLRMRRAFIKQECSAYSLAVERSNDALREMMIKRKIEVLREHMHMSLSVFAENYETKLAPLWIPLDTKLLASEDEKRIPTSPFVLRFINDCLDDFLQELLDAHLEQTLSDSVCLQLVYCSFRLRDLNQNYHSLFLNKICESNLFAVEQVKDAIEKRRELASKYT